MKMIILNMIQNQLKIKIILILFFELGHIGIKCHQILKKYMDVSQSFI